MTGAGFVHGDGLWWSLVPTETDMNPRLNDVSPREITNVKVSYSFSEWLLKKVEVQKEIPRDPRARLER
jgi:hypothetical protein